jgi:endonuclease-3
VNEILEGVYGEQKRGRRRDPLDSLILTIMSQSTSDHNRDMAYEAMMERYPDWEAVARAPTGQLASTIRSGGLANQKAARIKETLRWVKKKYGDYDLSALCDMEVGGATKVLLSQNGVGIKTAYVVLTFSCGHDVFPLDTHIYRILGRLGILPPGMTREKAHEHMAGLVPPGKAYSMHLNVLQFGRDTCHARNPECDGCPLRRMCVWVKESR